MLELSAGRTSNRVAPLLVAALVAALCAALAIPVGNVLADVTDWSLPLLLVTSALAMAPVVWGLAKRRLDVFEPVAVLASVYLVMYGLGALAYLTWGAPVERPDPRALTGASWYCVLGLIFFYVGYYAPPIGRSAVRPPAPEERWSPRALGAVCVVLVAIPVGAFAAMLFVLKWNPLVPETAVGLHYSVYLLNLMFLYQVAFWIYLSHSLRHGGSRAVLWAFFLGGMGLYAFTKGILALYVLGTLAIYHYRGRPVRFSSVVAVTIAIFLIAGGGHLVDQALRYRNLTGRSLIADVPPAQLIYRSQDFDMFPLLMMLQTEAPRTIPLQYGRTFWALPATPIPRGIWANKPVSVSGLVNYRLFPYLVEQGYFRAVSILGELYMNFAGWGVLGMVLFGLAARRLYQYLQARPKSLWAPVVYAICVNGLVYWLRDDLTTAGTTFLLQMAALGAAALVLMPRPAARSVP
jgi:hypothetical protein